MNTMNDKDICSIYDKFDFNKNTKSESKDSMKSYKNKVSWAKSVIFDKQTPKNIGFKEMCLILKYIIEEIDHINVDDFDSIYSTAALRRLGVKNLVDAIINNAPEKVKYDCAFENKRIVISSVWADYYKQHYKKLSPTDIFFCSGDLKSGLVRAAKSKLDSVKDGQNIDETNKKGIYKKERVSKAKTVHGVIIDEIIYKNLTDFLNQNTGTFDFVDKLKYLACIKQILKEKKESLPGIFEVIRERGCYDNLVDFYMFNSPQQIQTFYLDDYMEIRRTYIGMDDDVGKMIEAIYESYIEEEEMPLTD